MNRFPPPTGPSQRRLIDTGPTQPRVVDTGPTQPRVDPEMVARALGAEPVGPAGANPGFTFADVRARVAALIATRDQNTGPRVRMDVGPVLRDSIDELTAELHAEGTPATPSEVAEVLLEMSIEWARTNRAVLAAKLRERAARAGGQPS